jgi:hypothetical protein
VTRWIVGYIDIHIAIVVVIAYCIAHGEKRLYFFESIAGIVKEFGI